MLGREREGVLFLLSLILSHCAAGKHTRAPKRLRGGAERDESERLQAPASAVS